MESARERRFEWQPNFRLGTSGGPGLEDLKHLKTAVLSKMMFEPPMSLSAVLQESLEQLTVVCHTKLLTKEDRDRFHDPFVSNLQAFTVTNMNNMQRISKNSGEGTSTRADISKEALWARVEQSPTAQWEQKTHKLDQERQQEGNPPLAEEHLLQLKTRYQETVMAQIERLPESKFVPKTSQEAGQAR